MRYGVLGLEKRLGADADEMFTDFELDYHHVATIRLFFSI